MEEFDVLLLTHGELAKGYWHTLKMILNMDESKLDVLCLKEGESPEEFEGRIEENLEKYHQNKKIVILLDIPGGTPANVALRFMSDSRKLIAGTNLVIAMEVMMEKLNHTPWENLDLDQIIEDGKNSIVYYNRLVKEE
ncbi:MAG TPA: hypothetical protein IAA51_08905 [Candidatus Cottocaccamicrobium excrementipullorum]|nr:hypothetical protein [Candidatus Cottocaccamicrobium excrementipullorum]